MNSLEIDADDLINALTWDMESVGGGWYLDRETGQVLLDHEDSEDLPEGFEDDPRYLYVGPMSSEAAYVVMRNFVDDLPEGPAAAALGRALDGHKPFRRFKDTLFDYPGLRAEWFRFEREAHLRTAAAWCRENGIEAVWREPR